MSPKREVTARSVTTKESSRGSSRKRARGLFALICAFLAALLPLSMSAEAQSGSGSLDDAVVEAMGVESSVSERSFAAVREEGRTQVNVMRSDGEENWAFGSAVIEAPKKKGHYPRGWLFVAEATGEGWNVALEDTEDFPTLTSEAPEEVVSEDEKQTFAPTRTTNAAAPARTNLMLPWRKGAAWRFTGGPHGWNTGYDRPYAALDFTGPRPNDQRVRAAGGGQVYTMCSNRRGWVRIYHPNGYTTDYYHLIQNIRPKQGSRIKIGAILGKTGQDVSCGGAAYGRHVHFALLKGQRYVPVNGKFIGGWKFVQGSAYNGYAKRKNVTRYPVSSMKNFGR